MSKPFKPIFADLAGNEAAVEGTGPVSLGPPLAGHAGLGDIAAPGDRFFYCLHGIEKPAEREVGRATMLADGTVEREAAGGSPIAFTGGAKSITLVAAAEWYRGVDSALQDFGASGNLVASGFDHRLGPADLPARDCTLSLDNSNYYSFLQFRSWEAGTARVDATILSFRQFGLYLDGHPDVHLRPGGNPCVVVGSAGFRVVGGSLGYGEGAGGTATQLGAKSATVTLDRPSGRIILSDEALGGSQSVSFFLSNSLVGANDVVVASIAAGAAAGSYRLGVTAVEAGRCRFQLDNLSPAPLSEALAFNFAVIKAAAA